jgi:hypothetical protein
VHDSLTNRMRNLLAHLDINREIVHLDDFDDTSRIESVVPVVHYMARELLNVELRYLSENSADAAAPGSNTSDK